MLKSPLSARPVIEALEARIAPATLTVTTTADSGPGSLRQAILDANARAGADTIGFDIPGDQFQVIALTSALPAITDKVTISGTQPSDSIGKIRLDGTNAGPDALGLRIATDAANGTSIEWLQIANFAGSGVLIDGSVGVEIKNSQIFGNGLHGVYLKGGSAAKIYADFLGAHPNIEGSTGNKGDGLLIENSSSNLIGISEFGTELAQGNSIVTNGLFGIEIRGGSGNIVAGNTITGNGILAASNEYGGGVAVNDAKSTILGGRVLSKWRVDPSYGWVQDWNVAGNSISVNRGNGILITGQGSVGTSISGNSISGNLMGDGIRIDGASDTTFGAKETRFSFRGGYEKMIGNTVSQNAGWGVAVINGASHAIVMTSTIEGNIAGGVLFDNALNSRVGGLTVYYDNASYPGGRETSRDENIIRLNSGMGVVVRNSSSIEITSNRFIGTGLPIDLNGDGTTANDSGDVDAGANHSQNYPTITVSDGQIIGKLETDAINTKFRIQTYTFNSSTNEFTLFDTREVTTDAGGVATLAIEKSSISTTQQFLATATNLFTGETSEFSSATTIKPRVSIGSATTTEGSTGVQQLSFTVTLDYATTVPVKVGYRSADGTAIAGEDYGAVEGTLVFEPGETSKTINVPIFGDPIEERTESFYVNLTGIENGNISTLAAIGTIINDDGLPTISIQDMLTVEGASSISTNPAYSKVQYTLTLSKPSLDPVTVKLGVVGGSATAISDYGTIDSTITFAPGTTSVTKTLIIYNDTVREETETIQLQLSNPTASTLGNANAVVSIVDDDTWVIQADTVQMAEGDGQSVAIMKVRLVNSSGATDHTHTITVNFTTQNGTATAGNDYVATQGTLTFQPGEFEKTISVPILGDSTAEQNEIFSVKFSTPVGATLQQTERPITLLNDDPGVLTVAPASIIESHSGQKMLVFNVSMSAPMATPVVVNYETHDGTALASEDYVAVAGELSFTPGETQKTISVPILGDRASESDETFTLKLTGASGVSTATGTILNDDPFINIESATFLEGQPTTPGTRSVYLPVRLSQAADIPVSVDFTTSNGSAEAPSDYIATSGTLTFAAGQTLQYIELQIIGDQIYEPDETFSVKLSNPHGAEIGTDTGAVTIKADEPFISAQDVTIAEGHSGTKSLVFRVNLSHAQNSAVTVDYTTADGTATAGSDYAAISGTLAFAPGETTKAVSIPVQGDTVQEANETVRLLLSGATGATLVQDEATGTILNDDVTLGATNLIISKGGRKATWTDSDGDLVTLVATKPVLTLSSFHFGQADGSDNLVLEQLDATFLGNVKPFGLDFSVKKSATGDGLVNVGEIDATGRDLTTISLPGRLGAIQAGDSNLNTPAIRKLTVNSFGMDSATAQTGVTPLLSEVKGSIGSFAVKHDFTGANLIVSGGSVQSLVIGGDIEGISSEAPSGISIEKNLSTLKVGGDVSHTNVLAGTGSQKGAHVGQVLVKGNWSASNLAVGAGAGADGYFGTEDDIALQDTASRIARITIRGAVSGTAEAESGTDHFGFVAGRIAAFQVGAQKLDLSSKWKDSMEVGSTFDVMLRELAGRSRA